MKTVIPNTNSNMEIATYKSGKAGTSICILNLYTNCVMVRINLAIANEAAPNRVENNLMGRNDSSNHSHPQMSRNPVSGTTMRFINGATTGK